MSRFADYFGENSETIKRYVDILLDRGMSWGLIGPREGDRLWERHILNSVAAAGMIPTGANIVDVGSGAGLPGLPLAILRPDLQVTLVESLLRRSEFLELAVAELGLADRVTIVRARAEEHHGHYQVVTSRAVAPLPRLVGWTRPLLARGGSMLALKGQSAAEELRDAKASLSKAGLVGRVHEVTVPVVEEPTWVIEVTHR
jgi:16S rRNA (guanine527-N7)-methyltransferase